MAWWHPTQMLWYNSDPASYRFCWGGVSGKASVRCLRFYCWTGTSRATMPAVDSDSERPGNCSVT